MSQELRQLVRDKLRAALDDGLTADEAVARILPLFRLDPQARERSVDMTTLGSTHRTEQCWYAAVLELPVGETWTRKEPFPPQVWDTRTEHGR